jgi:hypothetical protein
MAQDLLVKLGWSGFSLVFLIVGLYTMNKGRAQRARSERIAETETTEIRDLQPGTVEVKGAARPAEDSTVFDSPIQREDALAARVEVEEWESSGQGGGSWETKHEEQTAVPMTVDDGTGEVRVELPEDGVLNVEETRTKVGSGDEPPEQIQRYLENEADVEEATRHDLGPLSIGDRRRYSEGMIEPGEEVYVLGNAREEQAGWGERERVIDKPTGSGDFILSDKSEADLIREGKRGGLVYLAFGGLFTVVGTAFTIYPWVAL